MLHAFVGYINYVKCWFCWNGVVRRLFCHLLVPLYSFQDRAADNYRSSVQYVYWCACLCHWVLIKTYLWIHVHLNDIFFICGVLMVDFTLRCGLFQNQADELRCQLCTYWLQLRRCLIDRTIAKQTTEWLNRALYQAWRRLWTNDSLHSDIDLMPFL